MNNTTLLASNTKLTAEVANLTKKLGNNTGGNTGGNATDKCIPTTCTHFKRYGSHKPDDCFELENNSIKHEKNWKSNW